MTQIKSAFAGLAAAGLLVSQVAVAAPVSGSRTGAAVDDSEGLGGMAPGSAPIVALLALMAVVAAIAVIDDGGDDEPVSP